MPVKIIVTTFLLILLITYPDSARIIGNTRHSGGIGGGGTEGNQISVRDSRGRIHCVYSTGVGRPYASNVPSDIYYVYSIDNGMTWSMPMNVSNIDTCNSDKPCIAVDSRDVLHLVWRQFHEAIGTLPRGEDLYYSYFENGIWSEPVNISKNPGTKVSYYSSLVVDSTNCLHVVWDRQTGSGNWDIFYSCLDGDTWSTPYNISQDPYDSAFPCLAIDRQGNLHLAYRIRTTYWPIIYRKYNGNYWSLPEVVSDTFFAGNATIVVDSRNNPHIVFPSYYYTKQVNNQWTYPQRIIHMGDTLCRHFDFAIDSCDNLYMVWEARIPSGSTYREDIYYCTYNGTIWSNPINLTQDTSRSWTPKLGNPVHSSGVDLIWLDLDPTHPNPCTLDVVYMRLNPVVPGLEETPLQNLISIKPSLKIYPNPAKSVVRVQYSLPVEGKVTIQLFDISGRLIKTLVDEYKKSDNYSLTLNTKTLPTGVYFLSLQTDEKRVIERLVVVK